MSADRLHPNQSKYHEGLALDAETPPIVLRAGLRDGSGRASIDGITLKSAQTYSILEHDFELH
jgi:hypothetical protein